MNYKTVVKYKAYIPTHFKTFRSKMVWLKSNLKFIAKEKSNEA